VEELELAERQRLMQREIESFSGADQQILVWSLVDGVSLVEIAARLNMSHEAVRARKSRMVKKITRSLPDCHRRCHRNHNVIERQMDASVLPRRARREIPQRPT